MWNEIASREECPHVSIPLNTVKALRPHAYGCHCESLCLIQKTLGPDGQARPLPTPVLPSANALRASKDRTLC